jgi:zinc D-Ala-D-Ala dipeptidase
VHHAVVVALVDLFVVLVVEVEVLVVIEVVVEVVIVVVTRVVFFLDPGDRPGDRATRSGVSDADHAEIVTWKHRPGESAIFEVITLYYAQRVGRSLVALVVVLGTSGARTAGAEPRPLADDLVDVSEVVPDIVLDLRYATADNFTGEVLYPVARCKLRRAVATRLARAAKRLRAQNRRLLVWDCYRPRSIQAELWQRVPDPRYVADPKLGSRHNRGAAIDLGLADLDGNPVALPTAFDDFSASAHRKRALAGTRGAEARRLDKAMRAAGFIGLATEWWHYDAPDAAKYALSDEPL